LRKGSFSFSPPKWFQPASSPPLPTRPTPGLSRTWKPTSIPTYPFAPQSLVRTASIDDISLVRHVRNRLLLSPPLSVPQTGGG